MTEARAARPFVRALSGLRFVPALGVVVAHVVTSWRAMVERPGASSPEFVRWCADGVTAFTGHPVALGLTQSATGALGGFFELSGFVLAYVYLADAGPTALDRRAFWAARVARIYPLYLLGLAFALRAFVADTIAAGSAPEAPPLTPLGLTATVLSAVLLLQAWWPRAVLAWNAPAWSLSCEAFFYLVFPWTIRLVDRLRARGLLVLAGACWLAAMAAPLAYLALDPDRLGPVGWTSEGWWLRAVKFGPLFRFPEFLLGVALGKLWLVTAPRHGALRRFGPWLSGAGALAWLATGLLCVRLGISFLLMHNGFLDLAFAAMVFGLALGGGPLHRALAWRPVALLGDASYALYLLHLPAVLYVLLAIAPFGAPPLPPAAFAALVCVASAAAAAAVHLHFEVPARRLVRALLLAPPGEDWQVTVRREPPAGVARAG
ncbi:MAG TPA: acyltransferase [Candidatus Binatia bacterium]|jgi:peptidoglycan/LPS O-acetylase OafA/YrhL|nr:acyltransferase [Candidatus Binatia bacterium]